MFLPPVLLPIGITPKARVEGGLAHLGVACTDASPRPEVGCRRRKDIEVSHPLLKTRLGAVDVKDVAALAGDRRIPKHPNSALERVLDSRRFEVVRCVAQIAFFALQ